MASYDNLTVMEQPWMIRSEIFNPWISEELTEEGEVLAKSVHSSFGSNSSYGPSYVLSDELLESIFLKPDAMSFQTPSVSVGSEKETSVSNQRRRSVPLPPSGKVAKRKSRAKKRASTTTFITADPANFRQMVQQVTGAKFGAPADEAAWNPASANPILHPGGGLQTLDTSAFMLDGSDSQVSVDGCAVAAAEHYGDSFSCFPTLESWKA